MPNTKATLALAVSAAIASQAGMAQAEQQQEKCFGVALAGQNDCAAGAGTSCAGTARVDYEGDEWKLVPKGTCLTLDLPAMMDGTPRTGSLTPLQRDLPKG